MFTDLTDVTDKEVIVYDVFGHIVIARRNDEAFSANEQITSSHTPRNDAKINFELPH